MEIPDINKNHMNMQSHEYALEGGITSFYNIPRLSQTPGNLLEIPTMESNDKEFALKI